MSNKLFLKPLIDTLSPVMKTAGFKKTGKHYSKSNGDLYYDINLQSSIESTSTTLKLTVNVQITSAMLHKLEDISIPMHQHSHYSQRIGFYLDTPYDKWWLINNEKEAVVVGNEIAF